MVSDAQMLRYVRLKRPPVRFSTFDDFLAACGIRSLFWLPTREYLKSWSENLKSWDVKSWTEVIEDRFGPRPFLGSSPFGGTALLTHGIIAVERQERSTVVSEVSHEALHNLAGPQSFEEEGGMLVLNRAFASGIEDREDLLDTLCRYGFSDVPLGGIGRAAKHLYEGVNFLNAEEGWRDCLWDAKVQGLVTDTNQVSPEILLRMQHNHDSHPDTRRGGFEVLNPFADVSGP